MVDGGGKEGKEGKKSKKGQNSLNSRRKRLGRTYVVKHRLLVGYRQSQNETEGVSARVAPPPLLRPRIAMRELWERDAPPRALPAAWDADPRSSVAFCWADWAAWVAFC
jgi:hypothetical protein